MTSHRPTICGTRHAVSAGHYLAAMAGFSILEAGGNAIDAGLRRGDLNSTSLSRNRQERRRREVPGATPTVMALGASTGC